MKKTNQTEQAQAQETTPQLAHVDSPATAIAAPAGTPAAVRIEMPKTTRPCGCGCGAEVRRTYLPGHDAKLKSALIKAAKATIARDTNIKTDAVADLLQGIEI